MSQQRKVLIVEDEPMIADAMAARLRAEGYDVCLASDGPAGERAAEEYGPDLAILDVMLPGFDGLELCRRLQARQWMPVLMVTARDDEADIVIGLGVGADDYLTKPFRMRELVARCGALLRRVERAGVDREPAQLIEGDLTVDLRGRRVWRDGQPIHLTSTEFELLALLIQQPGVVITRDALMVHVWDWANARGTRTLDSHIKALRAKIGAEHIRTSHGVGYAWEPS